MSLSAKILVLLMVAVPFSDGHTNKLNLDDAANLEKLSFQTFELARVVATAKPGQNAEHQPVPAGCYDRLRDELMTVGTSEEQIAALVSVAAKMETANDEKAVISTLRRELATNLRIVDGVRTYLVRHFQQCSYRLPIKGRVDEINATITMSLETMGAIQSSLNDSQQL